MQLIYRILINPSYNKSNLTLFLGLLRAFVVYSICWYHFSNLMA